MARKRDYRVVHWPGDPWDADGCVPTYPPLYNRGRTACGQLALLRQLTRTAAQVTCGHCRKTAVYREASDDA